MKSRTAFLAMAVALAMVCEASAATFRFGFQGVVLHHGGAAAKRIPDASGALLENVGQFMAEQLLSLDAVGVVISGSEVNV